MKRYLVFLLIRHMKRILRWDSISYQSYWQTLESLTSYSIDEAVEGMKGKRTLSDIAGRNAECCKSWGRECVNI